MTFPQGYYVTWSGQFEYLQRAEARMRVVVPVTLLIIFLLLYLNFRRLTETLIVMLSLPFSLVGGLLFVWWLGFNLSVAVVVGFIALAGVAAETGVIMLIYLDHAWEEVKRRRAAEGRAATRADLHDAIMFGAVERVRPKIMTVVAIMAGAVADPVVDGHRLGSHAADRGADDRRHGLVDPAHPDLRRRAARSRCGCWAALSTASPWQPGRAEWSRRPAGRSARSLTWTGDRSDRPADSGR